MLTSSSCLRMQLPPLVPILALYRGATNNLRVVACQSGALQAGSDPLADRFVCFLPRLKPLLEKSSSRVFSEARLRSSGAGMVAPPRKHAQRASVLGVRFLCE